jgi:hypothetical protein
LTFPETATSSYCDTRRCSRSPPKPPPVRPRSPRARSREPRLTPSAHGHPTTGEATSIDHRGPRCLGHASSILARMGQGARIGEAGNHYRLAPSRFSFVLAMEKPTQRWPAEYRKRRVSLSCVFGSKISLAESIHRTPYWIYTSLMP